MAAGVLYAIENDKEGVAECRNIYGRRIQVLRDILTRYDMELATEPGAGFFTLWQTPNSAFGQQIRTAREFNFLMIEKTGLVGVHFDPFTRYAVTGDIESMTEPIEEAFSKAKVSY